MVRYGPIVLASLATLAEATQEVLQLTYSTVTVTECFAYTGLTPTFVPEGATPIIKEPAVTGGPVIVELEGPACLSCGCDKCKEVVVYTTTFDVFCRSGLCPQAYEVTETYRGVPAKPTMPPTDVPYGFACEVQTCYKCGSKPITATITHPVSVCPYITDISEPSPAPAGAKPYNVDVSIKEGGDYEAQPGYYSNPAVDSQSANDVKNHEYYDSKSGSASDYASDYAHGSSPGADGDKYNESGSYTESDAKSNAGASGDAESSFDQPPDYGKGSESKASSDSSSDSKAESLSSGAEPNHDSDQFDSGSAKSDSDAASYGDTEKPPGAESGAQHPGSDGAPDHGSNDGSIGASDAKSGSDSSPGHDSDSGSPDGKSYNISLVIAGSSHC